ncbi:LOW QUALITY PROTEIN: uncharacterized protein [Diadema setosum]|uniref:LOW QUALITY PROTEIN: uncharacterized protein n=1 Tax=Diadema setosum TaxID=31175 RepID=UPI003B3B0005
MERRKGIDLFLVILATLCATGYAADFPFSFFTKSPYTGALYTNKTAEVAALNESECASACLYAHQVKCVAFEFDFGEEECFIVSDDDVARGINVTEMKESNYYTKLTGECPNPPVGLEDGTISLSQISMSSYLGGVENGPLDISRDHVRLNSPGGWCAGEVDDINNVTEWIQIDFNEPKVIGAVSTQGFDHPDLDAIYCSEYYLSYVYSDGSGGTWSTYQESAGQTTIFTGNSDKNGIVNNTLANPITATSIRLHPTVCHNHPCMRLEFYGCREDCVPNPCFNSSCTDSSSYVWNVTCDCQDGMSGDFCQVNEDECASNPCQNGGECIDHVNYYTCSCKDGFVGYHCQTDFDECASNPCQNGATCVDDANGYNCTCVDGFAGPECADYAVNCTDGYFPGINSCYMVSLSQSSLQAAEAACSAISGHLVYVTSTDELDIIAGILTAENVPESKEFMTGLTYDSSGSGTVSIGSTSTTVGLNGWASGYPSGNQACIAIVADGSSWAWANVACSDDLEYICEQDKTHGNLSEWASWEECSVTCGPGEGVQLRHRYCDSPAPLLGGDECEGEVEQNRTCGTICPIVDCPDGFITKYDTCYLLRINDSATYDDAKTDCQNLTIYGGHLLFVNSLYEENYIAGVLADKYADQTAKYYTGVKVDVASGNVTFDWEYGSSQEMNSTSWDEAGDSMWSGGSHSTGDGNSAACTMLEKSGSTWKVTNEPCSQSLGYICEVNLGDGNWGSWQPWGECNGTCGSGHQTRVRLCNDPAPVLGGANCTGISEQTQTCTSVCPNVTCPAGFSVYDESCYMVIDDSFEFTDQNSARRACLSLTNDTGHLAYVQSFEELEFLGFRLEDSEIGKDRASVYVGLTYSSGDIYYANSTLAVNLTGWNTDQLWVTGYPSASAEECMAMFYDDERYQWLLRDIPCHRSLGYICEITKTHGNWGSWLGWSECSERCGNGTQTRQRVCDSPTPILDGDSCPGPANQTRNCSSPCSIVSCPAGYEPFYDSCYSFFVDAYDNTTMENANITCKEHSNYTGHVVHVDSYEEQFFLNWALKNRNVPRGDRIFIGHSYVNSAMLYYGSSINGPSSATWPNSDWWARDFPRDQEGRECVAMMYDFDAHEWLFGDVPCEKELGFICEVTQAPGDVGEWGPWSRCTDNCGHGTQERTRECNNPAPILDGQFCQDNLTDTRACWDRCPIVDCPAGWTASYSSCYKLVNDSANYETYSSANDSCVTMSNYTGQLLYINNQTELDEVSWWLKNMGMTESKEFFTGLVYQSDTLSFDDGSGGPDSTSWRSSEEAPWVKHYPAGAGSCVTLGYNSRTWEWRLMDSGCDTSRPYICEIAQTDGNWGSWGEWSDCSQTCDSSALMGTRQRNRTCSNPAPILDGQYCEGNRTEFGACGTVCPPENGNYTDWAYGECSVSCYSWDGDGNRYGGWQNRTRNCTNPPPMYGGDDCSSLGDAIETVACGTEDGNACPAVNGQFGEWSNWTECNVTCGSGYYIRTRQCDSPAPQHDGNDCVGADTELDPCTRSPCPVNGSWAEWSAWSVCSQTCVGGTQYRTRTCTDPEPAYNGTDCVGNDAEWRNCSSNITCPTHGGWSEWSDWSECSLSCGGLGSQSRNRSCTNPSPADGGADCPSNETSTQTQICGTHACPIDGGLGDWQGWSDCSIHCGSGGVRYRYRACDNPSPQHGGNECDLNDQYITETCDSSTDCSSERVNMYSDKSTSQSSTASDGSSNLALDGTTSGQFSSGSCILTESESTPWWQVDLGGVYAVRSIKIYARTDACSSCSWSLTPFVVRLGLSNTPSDNVRCGEKVTSSASTYDVSCNLLTGRYLAIQSVSASNTQLSFCEVEIDIGSYAFQDSTATNMTYSEASGYCQSLGAELATSDDLQDAYDSGTELCRRGWLADGTSAYVVQTPRAACGGAAGSAGVVDMGQGTAAESWDAFCIDRSDGEPLTERWTSGSYNITASSSQSGLDASKAALYGGSDTDAWVPANATADGEYLQFDFGQYVSLKGVATRGRPCCDAWVTGYYLSYSIDGNSWNYYGSDATRLIQGNLDNSSVVRHSLDPVNNVRYVRIEPKTWNNSIAMRVRLYGTVQQVNGAFGGWNAWGTCSVPCEGTGTHQRTRSCDLPPQQDEGLKCRANRQLDQVDADLPHFFSRTINSKLDAGVYAMLPASSPFECAAICVTDSSCSSCNYDYSNSVCTLSNTSVTFGGESLTSSLTHAYFGVDYTSCNVHYIVEKARGNTPQDGIYTIRVGLTTMDVYCDMTTDGGGWTLLVSAVTASGWSASNVEQRNESYPSLNQDYSILTYADDIKSRGLGSTFKYRLESVNRGRWGGIYEVPFNYSFTNEDSSQNSTLVEMFDTWRVGNESLQHIMPYLTSSDDTLLRAHDGVDAASVWAGTIVCNCEGTAWQSYTNWYEPDEVGANSTTGSGSRRRRRSADEQNEDDEFDFKYAYQIGGRENREVQNVLSRNRRSSSSSSSATQQPVWYWMREDHHGLQPSLEWDMSGRCWYDSGDILDCSSPCPDGTITATNSDMYGVLGYNATLASARDGAEHKCALKLDSNHLDLGDLEESCLYNPRLCTQGLSMALWLHLEASGTVDETTYIVSSSGLEVSLSNIASGGSGVDLQLTVKVQDDYEYEVSNDTIPVSEWFHVAITYKRDRGLRLYMDGELVASQDSSQQSSSTPSAVKNVYIGGHFSSSSQSGYDVIATVSDLQVFFKRLSTMDAKLLYLGSDANAQGETCNEGMCPIHGGWTSFTNVGDCSVECGGSGVQEQSRACSNPTPQYSGDQCVGDEVSYVSCQSPSSCSDNEDSPLGMESGNITNAYLSESACSADNDSCAIWARLNDPDSTRCWMPDLTVSQEPWLQIALAEDVYLKGVATSGRPGNDSYVTEYRVATSTNGNDWDYVMDGSNTKVFRGNFDNTTVVRHHVNVSQVSYVRFYPVSWNIAVCMRVEIYGEHLPIDGRYGPWGDWSECNVTCGGGLQFRNRTCDNPAPKYGGQTCSAAAIKSRECNTNNCPIDGGWSSWETAVSCSVTCGLHGTKRQSRECNNPQRRYGGNPCDGEEYRWVGCSTTTTCDSDEDSELGVINGDIADSQFSESSCASDGSNCGSSARINSTTSTDCWMPVNSTTSEWLEVNLTDSVSLKGVAIQGRPTDDNFVTSYYLLTAADESSSFEYYQDASGNPMLFQGNFDNAESVRYNLNTISEVTFVRFEPQSWNGSICMRVGLYGTFNPIDGNWASWSSWDNCSTTCGGGVQNRTRTCTNPSPKYGGANCTGDSWEMQGCNDNPCPIDGGLGSWYSVSDCSVSCGLWGTHQQERDCNNPTPQYGGQSCSGITQRWASCNGTDTCDNSNDYALGVANTSRSDILITASSKKSNAFLATYARLDASDRNEAWTPDDSDSEPYLQIELPDLVNLKRIAIQGRLGNDDSAHWVRTFYLKYKDSEGVYRNFKEAGARKIFQGNFDETTTVVNELHKTLESVTDFRLYPVDFNNSIAMRVELYGIYLPRDGNWTAWSEWTECPVTCGGAKETRNRTCTNPTARYGGEDCPSDEAANEERWCNTHYCPIDGDWTDWASWTSIDCSVSCGGDGVKHRTRSCTNPAPQHGGAGCSNPDYVEEFEACSAASSCGDCYEPLGMYDGRITDAQVSASNTRYNDSNLPSHARLEVTATNALCWEGKPDFNLTEYLIENDVTNKSVTYNFTDYWFQVDFVTPIQLSMLGVQGGGSIERWVTYYNVSLTTDGENWFDYEENGVVKQFYGNNDKSTVVRTTLDTAQENIKSLRILPQAWEGAGPCLRLEVYGCFDHPACSDQVLSSISTAEVAASGSDPAYVSVDLGSLQKVTQLRTLAEGSRYLESYYVYFSQNDFDWALYVEDGARRDFQAQYDSSISITNPFLNPFHARYLKVVPISYSSGISKELEVLTCSADVSLDDTPTSTVCFTPFGFADRSYNLTFRASASSKYPSSNSSEFDQFLPEYARLHNPSNPTSGLQGWVSADLLTDANYSSVDQWYQIDFQTRVTVAGLAVQGVPLADGSNATFDRFSLWYSEDAVDWKPMTKMGSSEAKVFDGPSDGHTVILVELTDDTDSDLRPLDLRYLQIRPEVNTSDAVGLRLEIYGCDAQVSTVCNEGWSEFQTSCYKVFTDGKSRSSAKNYCESQGAHLATITSLDEQRFLRKFVRAYDAAQYNIGFRRHGKTFRWVDDTFVVYTSWADNNPLYERYRKCVAMSKSEDGKWVSVDCDNKIGYVCEYEREYTSLFACAENTVSLHCPDNYRVNITGGDWGRTMDWEVCPQQSTFTASDVPCTSAGTAAYSDVDDFAATCANASHCSIVADASTLGYPCTTSGMSLHINLTYTCEQYMQYARACEGDFLEISCPAEGEVIHVIEAMYGRTLDSSVCRGPEATVTTTNTDCRLNSSLADVRTYCEGHHACKVVVEPAAFQSDPCEGEAKYLDVNYTCVSGAPVITDEYTYQGDCEQGWTKHDLRCLKGFPNQNKTFREAEEQCNELHGHLAGIPGDHTQTFLKGLMTDYAEHDFWIGCVKTRNNTCRWRDGIGHVFTEFNAGYVSDGKKKCIRLSADHSFAWEDAWCTDRSAYICQQDCVLTFGMEDKTIGNHQLAVSSTKITSALDTFKWDARLNDPYGAWVASDKDTQQYLQIDFERVMRVRKFATQGHPAYDYWTTHYALEYTVNDTMDDQGIWNTYEEEGEKKIFVGNNDSNSIVYQYLRHFMFARYIRILPLNWTNEISLRVEVYGCYLEDEKPEVLEVVNSTKLHYGYNGTIQCLAFGMPLPNITWIRDGYDYVGDDNSTIVSYALDDHHMVSEIRFHPLYDDRGYYTCVARNQHGSDRSSFYNEKGLPLYEGGKIVCDERELTLNCPVGEYIQITGAFYGRLHNERCIIYDDYYPTDCEYDEETVMYRLQRQCDKKEHCVVHVSEAMFGAEGDNYTRCDGFTKYVNMTYECIGYVWTEWYNTDSPSDGIEDESHYSIYKTHSTLCADPQNADCRRVSDEQSHYSVGQVLQRPCTVNNEGGLVCYDADQTSGTCSDYEVRFLCPEEELGIWGHEMALECDDEELAIACQADYSIKVHQAFYGRREEGLCSVGTNYTYSLDCALNDELVLQMVQKNCDNKQTCRLNIEFTDVFSDPCPEQPKYLDIKFSCERYRSDFARGKAANMSSLASSLESVNATTDYLLEVDCSQGWCVQSADEYEPWWLVDLQATYDINVVTVYTCDDSSDAAALDNFQVRVGNNTDISLNEDCGDVVSSAQAGSNAVFCQGTISGRYVSIQVMERTDSIQICEVTVQHLGPKAVKALACDNQLLELSCAVNEIGYLQIESAFYGRREDGKHCPHRWSNHTYDSSCAADDSTILDLVVAKCQNKRQCSVDVASDILNSLASDPCQSELKYLEVEYSCIKFLEGNDSMSATYAVCKEEDLQIACYGSNRFIEITSAEYKPVTTSSPAWCTETPSDNTASCSSQDVQSVIAAQCDNKVTCTVHADDFYLGASACTTHKMQLEVTFDCKDDLPSGSITVFGCEGRDAELSLSCQDGTYIHITDAFYGRKQVGSTSYVCPAADGNDDTTTCESSDTLALVEAYCSDQRTCSIPVDGSLLTSTDPCSAISSKYLEVTYECNAGRPLNDITLYACQDHDRLSVECPTDYPHVRILSAEYGRTEDEFRCAYRENLPSFTANRECYTPGVLTLARDRCTNLQNCTVPSHWSNYVSKEPCMGTYKYLKVTYRCLMAAEDFRMGTRWYFINPYQELENHALSNHRLSNTKVRNLPECANKCLANADCVSFNYKEVWASGGYTCQLNDMIAEEVPTDFVSANGFQYFEKDSYRAR